MTGARILVDHSGYELSNLGDLAMLQHAVQRLARCVPDADIAVLSTVPARIAEAVPGVRAVQPWPLTPAETDQGPLARVRRSAGWRWKAYAHLPLASVPLGGLAGGVQREVAAADLVLATGGGYLTDTFAMHARGVLGILAAAQERGVATAMLGQGIGPVADAGLRARMAQVLPRLAVLGVRDPNSATLAEALGVDAGRVVMTGDDALASASRRDDPPGDVLGLNLRQRGYAGDLAAHAGVVRQVLGAFAVDRVRVLRALPVLSGADGDLASTRRILPDPTQLPGITVNLEPSPTPQDLARQSGTCRAVLTASYHAAVFALGHGVPVVGMSASAYYDGKFDALHAQFPQAVWRVRLREPTSAAALAAALLAAWELPAADRARTAAAAAALAGRADCLVQRLVAQTLGRPQVRA